MGILAVLMAGCVVTVAPGYTQEQGIYGYSYYYFPDYNFYYSPDINRYWWYQSDSWQYGDQLPPWYAINPNTVYIVINSRSINPTRDNNYYRAAYRNGDYRQQLRRVDQAPQGRLPFYRRPDQNQVNQNPGREPVPENRNPNYNNNGARKAFPSQTPESRQPQSPNQQQNQYNEGVRQNENQPNNVPQQKVETRQRPDYIPNTPPQVYRQSPQQDNSPSQSERKTENVQQPARMQQQETRQPTRQPVKRQEVKPIPQRVERPQKPPRVEEKVQTRQQ